MHLTKYAFPVIRSVIDRVGAPREIEKVAPSQRGPLLVTLAMDISSDCTRAICSHLEASTKGENLPAQILIPDMFEGLPVKGAGAGYILLMKNARWWTNFAQKAEDKFRTLADSTGPLRILLRNAVAHAAANDPAWDKKKQDKITYDAIWLKIAKSPQTFFDSARWPQSPTIRSLDEDDIRKWRSILIKEDSSQRKWIHAQSGPFHPSTSSYWQIIPQRIPEFTSWRARNELYFCLSQGESGLWIPFFSESFSEEDWHDWLDKAHLGVPPYWAKPIS